MDLPRLEAPKMLNISSCCRVCMKADCSLLSLFDNMIVEQQLIILAEALMNCTGIQVSQEDGLPQHICADCAKILETMCVFKIRALASESEFRKLVKSTLNEVKDEVIKSEMKQEEDDDIGHMDFLLEDFSEYCPLNIPKEECDSQTLGNSGAQAESFNCDQCSKKYKKKHKFLKHLKSHESPMYCDICRKAFFSKKTLNKHIKKHSSESLKCELCNEVFASEAFLFEHIVNHTNEANVKCPKCDIIFSRRRPFVTHIRKFHEMCDNELRDIKCDICQKEFTTQSLLKRHMKIHSEEQSHEYEKCSSEILQHVNNHDDIKNEYEANLNNDDHDIRDDISKNKRCDICKIKFHTKSLLNRHKAKLHSEEQHQKYEKYSESYTVENEVLQHMNSQDDIKNEYETHLNSDDQDISDDASNKQKCDVCKKKFASKSLLNRHMKLHSEDRPYICTKCTKRYSRQDQLLQHMKWHDGIKPYICSYCSKAFNQLCSLKDHIRIHTGETPYLCSECGKSFTNSSNLRQHLMRHSGVKPFTCNLCPKSFTTKGQMTAHMTTHTGAHPYKCEECGSSFTKANSLKKHKLIHLGVKPFACDTCNMRFSCKEHLKRHTRIHTGEKPYQCRLCARAFTQSNDLAKHLRTHVGQNIYQCTVCNMRFRLISELKQHYPTHYVNGDQVPTVTVSKGVEAPILMLKPQETPPEARPELKPGPTDHRITITKPQDPTPIEILPELKPMDPRITITINSNGFDKNGLAGDITINLSPDKS